MAVYHAWYAGKRILYARFEQHVSVEDIEAFCEQAVLWQAQKQQPVHVIFDQRESESLPWNIARFYACLDELTDGTGWRIELRQTGLLPRLLRFVGLAAGRTRTFSTMGAALAFLQAHDPTMPTLMLKQELA